MLFHSKLIKFCPFKSRCPIETFPAYLKMKYCLLFHLKLWIFEKNSSFVFKSRCQIGSFVTYLTMEFCLFFSSKLLFRMDFWYEFKSCPFQTSCQTESLVAYLTMEPCVLFHPKIWIVYQNSSPVLKSGCQIESFVSYLTMECSFKASCQYGFLVDLYGSLICIDFIMDMNSSLVLLKFFCLLWIFCHVSHNGILFAVSFKATCHSRLVLSNPDVKLKWLMY